MQFHGHIKGETGLDASTRTRISTLQNLAKSTFMAEVTLFELAVHAPETERAALLDRLSGRPLAPRRAQLRG